MSPSFGCDPGSRRNLRPSSDNRQEKLREPRKTANPRKRSEMGFHAMDRAFAWNGQTFGSLSQIAKAITGTNWNGHRFFGLRATKDQHTAVRLSKPGRIVPASTERHILARVD